MRIVIHGWMLNVESRFYPGFCGVTFYKVRNIEGKVYPPAPVPPVHAGIATMLLLDRNMSNAAEFLEHLKGVKHCTVYHTSADTALVIDASSIRGRRPQKQEPRRDARGRLRMSMLPYVPWGFTVLHSLYVDAARGEERSITEQLKHSIHEITNDYVLLADIASSYGVSWASVCAIGKSFTYGGYRYVHSETYYVNRNSGNLVGIHVYKRTKSRAARRTT